MSQLPPFTSTTNSAIELVAKGLRLASVSGRTDDGWAFVHPDNQELWRERARLVIYGAAHGSPICREPIATAPDDGTEILAWVGPGRVTDVQPSTGRTYSRKVKAEFMLVRWFKFGDVPGYWSTDRKGQGKVRREPTRWTALHT